LRAQIALYKAAGDHKLRQLVSPYQRYDLNLLTLVDGPSPVRGAGLTVEIDQKKFKLLLATGASGIAISPKAAKKAGFQGLTGDGYSVLANEVRIGELKLADVPVAAVSGDPPANTDGLIGADVFREFLVSIDFLHGRLSLEPFAERPADPLDDAPDVPATGFTRALRVGNRLTLRTSVNGRDGYLFLIDSGSFRNLLGTNAARETTRVYATDRTRAESATLVFAGLSGYDPGMVTIDTRYVTDGTGLGQSGILGMPVLRGLRLTIDYREGSVRLEQIRP
jgi:hypothetical protein